MNSPERVANVNLAELHTFGLPSVARHLVRLTDRTHFDLLPHEFDRERDCLLGEGSNTVFLNSEFEGTVWLVNTKGFSYLGVEAGNHLFKVEAGTNWHSWVEWSVAAGFPGLENLALIPGTVGAAPVQNIGAYGLELDSRIWSVECVDLQSGKWFELSRHECQFAYRDSLFKKHLNACVLIASVTFALPVKWMPVLSYSDVEMRVRSRGAVTPQNILKTICEIRSSKLPDPGVLGNAGSFFKNPLVTSNHAEILRKDHPDLPIYAAHEGYTKLAAGWLIDRCGLKGRRIGGVQVYPKQALVLINAGEGRAEELLLLIDEIVTEVQSKFGLTLEPEPNLR